MSSKHSFHYKTNNLYIENVGEQYCIIMYILYVQTAGFVA
jgi:hypothetical protein